MNWFSKPKTYLGIDFGTGGIKVTEFGLLKGKPQLLNYAYVEQPLDVIKNDSDELKQKIATWLTHMVGKAKMNSKKVVAGLPGYAIFSSIITLPKLVPQEQAEAVRWEAKKIVPLPLEEVVLDWKVLPSSDPAATNTRVLLTAAPLNLVKKYQDIIRLAGLEFVSLETDAFALIRSLLGGDKTTTLLVDVGSTVTHMYVSERGIPVVSRSVDIGGLTLTKAVSQVMNIDLRRAEQFKRDIGLVSGTEATGAPRAISTTFAPVLQEMKYVMEQYQQQTPTDRIEKVVLTGGSALLTSLPEFLAKELQLRVYLGDPWAHVVFPLELEPVLSELGSRFAVAVGLALRELL